MNSNYCHVKESHFAVMLSTVFLSTVVPNAVDSVVNTHALAIFAANLLEVVACPCQSLESLLVPEIVYFANANFGHS